MKRESEGMAIQEKKMKKKCQQMDGSINQATGE
jgi:hypothetical protein